MAPKSWIASTLLLALLFAGCSDDAGKDEADAGLGPAPSPANGASAASTAPPAGNAPASGGTSRPDQAIPPIVLAFTPEGALMNEDATFQIPPGARRLDLVVHLNATAAGPYATGASLGCACDAHLALRAPDGTYPWTQEFDPAAGNAAGSGAVQGPFEGSVSAPVQGEWTLRLSGTGQNVEVRVTGTVSFA